MEAMGLHLQSGFKWPKEKSDDMKLDSVFTDFITSDNISMAKVFGQLVVLGFDVTVFTPAPYQRHRL